MKHATLCILKDGKKICLGMKKRGFGVGKWNGFGGKVKEGESIEQTAKRELQEEVGVLVKSWDKVGELTFYFPKELSEKGWDQVVHVYLCKTWEGEPTESEEMKPQWFNFEEIPFEEMWDDDKHWLPLIWEGKMIKGAFSFNDQNKIANKLLECVDGF